MSIDRNDPRLTAYALGELADDERRAVAAEIAGDEALVAEVASIRDTAALLSEELGRQAPEALSTTQRRALEQAANEPSADKQTDEAGSADEKAPGKVTSIEKARKRFVTGWMVAGGAVAALAASTLLFMGTATLNKQEAAEFAASPPLPATSAESAGDLPMDLVEAAEAEADSKPAPASPGMLNRAMEAKKGKAAESEISARGAMWGDEIGGESYEKLPENPFVLVAEDPRSTFSVDVDTASYSLVRRHLTDGHLPPPGAVRIEEMINYFSYDYPEPTSDVPFSVSTEVSSAPWAPTHQLVRIGVKGKHVAAAARPRANLVFLLDVSGSMNSPDKLPLLKQGFRMLVDQLDANDRVSIVVYAGASGLVLPPTPGDRKHEILGALNRLEAGGSTNGGEGIQLAYEMAHQSYVSGGANRVILATDGDFNVGTTNQDELVRLIEAKARGGTFLSVLGFGSGNYQDSTLEKLADKGNGNYAYIDGVAEAQKVLVEQAAGTILTIAKDVKIQLEMNPIQVESFRLIGYENRVLAHRDFTDDSKDAGEIGADHTVTALYELVPKGESAPGPGSVLPGTRELMTIKLRYKAPTGDTSREIEVRVPVGSRPIASASNDQRFAAAVASFGMLLRGSQHRGEASYDSVLALARGTGSDRHRAEFAELVRTARRLSR
jgi:Ca-activated chloride channel family protein